jgi:hypothetical protein
LAARGIDIDGHRRHGGGPTTSSRRPTLLRRLSTAVPHQQEDQGDADHQHRADDQWPSVAASTRQAK